MAVGALPGEVIRRHFITMARRAVREPAVIECCCGPIAGVVTVGALARVMIGRRFPAVAGDTVRETAVIENRGCPVAGVMAI